MSQETIPARDPVEEWWDTYGDQSWQRRFEELQRNHSSQDPWSNGRYALSALVWGLIFLCVFGLGAGV